MLIRNNMLKPQTMVSGNISSQGYINLIGEEDNYIIGPGDMFTANVWTTHEEKLPILVEANGKASIPLIGVIDLHGLTYREAVEKLTKEISKKYHRAEITIALSTAKTVTVPVYGAVMNPGVYTVSGTQRIAELISLAGGVTIEANPRSVHVHNQHLSNHTVDLLEDFRVKGKQSSFVRSGDKLFIPNREDIVTISGAVHYPETYDYLENETLSHLITTSGGLKRGVDSSRILITRFINDVDSIVRFEISYELAHTFTLQPDDYIFVPQKKDYRVTRQVTVTGEVMFPGKYAVREDKTKLIDLIGLAGGLTDEAYLPGSYINRLEFTDAGLSEYERLQTMLQSDLSPDEKSYLKYRNAANVGRISLDFEELIKDEKELFNIILRGGDEIHIARKGLSVNIMGAVVNPGLINYKEGEDLSYYIKQAGGYQADAEKRRVKIVKGGTEIWLKPKQVETIDVGDAIWIPEKPYRDRLQAAKEILAITGSIATIIVTVITVDNWINGE